MAPLLHEMIEACPEELKMEHLRERENQLQETIAEKQLEAHQWEF